MRTRTITLFMVKAAGAERYLRRDHPNKEPLGSAHSGVTFVNIEAAQKAAERWQAKAVDGAKLVAVRVTMSIEVEA